MDSLFRQQQLCVVLMYNNYLVLLKLGIKGVHSSSDVVMRQYCYSRKRGTLGFYFMATMIDRLSVDSGLFLD